MAFPRPVPGNTAATLAAIEALVDFADGYDTRVAAVQSAQQALSGQFSSLSSSVSAQLGSFGQRVGAVETAIANAAPKADGVSVALPLTLGAVLGERSNGTPNSRSPRAPVRIGSTWAVIDLGFLQKGVAAGFDDGSGVALDVTDDSGNVFLRVLKSSSVQIPTLRVAEATEPELGASPLLDPEFRHAITTDDGAVVFGVRPDGSIFAPLLQPSDPAHVYQHGPAGFRYLRIFVDGRDFPLGAPPVGYEDFAPKPLGPKYSFLRQQVGGGPPVRLEEHVWPTSTAAKEIDQISHLPWNGQSLSIGTASSAPITTVPLNPGRALMFNGGTRPLGGLEFGDDQVRVPIPAANITDFVDLIEGDNGQFGETGIARLAARLLKDWPDGDWTTDEALLFSSHGIGGQNLANLRRGMQPYNNMLEAIRRAQLMCRILGVGYRVPATFINQGEGNIGGPRGAYKAALTAYQTELEQDVKALTGQSGKLPLFYMQISSWTASQAVDYVATDQLEAALASADGRLVCVGPEYVFDYFLDRIHMFAEGYAKIGEFVARAMSRVLTADQVWKPLHCTGATLAGTTLATTWLAPVAPIQIDTSFVTDPGGWGFTIEQTGGNAVTVTSATITGPNTLQLGLSAAPTGNDRKLGVAFRGGGGGGGRTSGPRCCLRDSSGDVHFDGTPMHNYAAHQLVPIA